MTTYIPKFDDWKSLGMVNNNLTWLAIKPEAQVLVFRNQEHSETYYFEKPFRCCLLICPIPNGEFNVEVGIKKEDYLQLKIRMEDLLDYFIQNHPELQQRFNNSICIFYNNNFKV